MGFDKLRTGIVVLQIDIDDTIMVLEEARYEISDIADINSRLTLIEVFIADEADMDNLRWVLVDGGINFDWE
tara:strand:- start:9 stop:224 length:216 start_codon:yes stop_codon:yes gene_type:complete